MKYMVLPFRRYFDFQGRSRRMEYWMFALLNVIVFTVFAIIFIAFFVGTLVQLGRDYGYQSYERYSPSGLNYETGWSADIPPAVLFDAVGPLGLALLVAVTLYSLLIFIPALAVTVRRLHDIDWSGWWAAVPYGANLLLILLGWLMMLAPDLVGLFAALASLLSLVGTLAGLALLVVMFIGGTRGPNRFGQDPKGPDVSRTFA